MTPPKKGHPLKESRVFETRYSRDINAKYRKRITFDGQVFWTKEQCCDKPIFHRVSTVFKHPEESTT
jgi:hypothetical protein